MTMDRTCIAIVDGKRARLFTFDRESDATGVHEDLEEREDLVDPQHRESDTSFARLVGAEIDKLVHDAPTRRLILCATPGMLGLLRALELDRLGIVIDEIDRDLVRLTPIQLRDYLASMSLLPEPPARPEIRP